MMGLESPLFLTRIECPVCGTVNEFETIRVGAYTEGERQSDFCPSFIKWHNPKYQKYNPLLFFTATCDQCFYTREFNVKFTEWSKDDNFLTDHLNIIKENHLRILSDPDSFIKLVGTSLDNEKYPDETAVLKLLLAAYDELLLDHPSNLDLGRFYLRIAWLFRQSGHSDDEQTVANLAGPYDDIEKSIIELRNWAAGLERNIEYFSAAATDLTSDGNEVPEESSSQPSFAPAVTRLEEIDKQLGQLMTELEANLAASRSIVGDTASSEFGREYYNQGSFTEFLNKLARMWDGVPCNELEAMRLAVRYYINAFESGREISHGNQSIQAAYLIAELSRRIGDHDTARQYFNTTIKMGQEFINEIKGDRTRTALARKILELALKQGKQNLAEAK